MSLDRFLICLVAGGFAVVVSVVLACFELAGFGVDGDAFAVAPGVFAVVEFVAEGFEAGGGGFGESGLKIENVG